ncbi:helix-turn-helix domain-containing protein [Pseudochelatococcus lubricantis]|uniref:helix-turn-helix domain-containing protein n=1 Tax=Pseudochelatococcus lubricantis TaxID=1538102 RepID=UPI0035EAA959
MNAPDEPLPLSSYCFELDELEPDDRYDALFDFYASAADVFVAPEKRRFCSLRVEHWTLGNMIVMDGKSSEVNIVRHRGHIARDDLDDWMLRVTRNGQMASRTDEQHYVASDGTLVFDTLAEAFVDHWSPAGWVSVVIPRGEIPELWQYFSRYGSGPVRAGAADLLADFLISLANRLPHADERDRDRFARALHGMIVACLQVEAAPGDVLREFDPALLRDQVRQIIRSNLWSARLTPERLSQLSGVSRSVLYGIFEESGGVAKYIQTLRLNKIYADLTDPGLNHIPIAELAEKRGFHNTSAFNRAFRRQFNCSPGDVRTATRMGIRMVQPSHPEVTGSENDISALLGRTREPRG